MSSMHDLGELQLAVMNVLWTQKQASVRETLEALQQDRKPAYNTVLTTLRSLEKRGLVVHECLPDSRKYVYRPVVSSHDAIGDILQDVLGRLFAGSPAMLIKYLVRTEGFSLVELREIRRAVERQESQIIANRVSPPPLSQPGGKNI